MSKLLMRSIVSAVLLCSLPAIAQDPDALRDQLTTLADTVAVTGYENNLAQQISHDLAGLHPHIDTMGNVTVTLGAGAPRRLIAAPIDEPGYVVSHIDPDGFLRVQREPPFGLPPHWNERQNAQPMLVGTTGGKWLPAVSAGLSIHLEPGRTSPPDPDDLENFYIDTGATSAAEVRRAGIDVLSPVAAERHTLAVGQNDLSGTAVGDRFGAAILLQLAHALAAAPPQQGSITLAFVTQQWSGSRGLTRVLEQVHPDELIFLGKSSGVTKASGTQLSAAAPPALGTGIWVYDATGEAGDPSIEAAAVHAGLTLHHSPAGPLLARGYGSPVQLPANTVHLGIPLRWPDTAGETIDLRDLWSLLRVLADYTRAPLPAAAAPQAIAAMPYAALPSRPTASPDPVKLLETLSLAYGVSEHEAMSRAAVEHMLPAWAHPTTDSGGNLLLQFGDKTAPPEAVFMAHTDELGFRIKAILPDGSLDLENKGGGTPAFYWGHLAVVHTSAGMRGGVVELPENYATADFHFPTDFRAPAKLYVGASDPAGVAALGIQAGDTVTIPKRFLHLLDGRVSIRSLDDRVGCTAMVHAVWQLGSAFHRNITFVWSTREELGLLGAGEYATAAAAAGLVPKTIFAIDTFVSSDSPLESKRFGDAVLGQGFVIRAIDNSNIAPWQQVQSLTSFAQQRKIPVQYGITGGGNDGSVFTRFGATDLALSWPLRYSHSPAELIDTRDLRSLSEITAALANSW